MKTTHGSYIQSVALPPFAERVRAVVRKIPKGKTMTYKEVATLAGSAGAARAVGMIMRNNYDPTVPCHRVIRSDGKLGGYNRGGIEMKEKMLAEEAVSIKRSK
jgi:methylated-DNA-[protein]-cysteine S-methyltransferase